MFGEARLRRSALLQIFARVFVLVANKPAGVLAGLRAAGRRLTTFAQSFGVAAQILARLTGRTLTSRLTIFLVGLAAETWFLRTGIALLAERLLSLALLANRLLTLLAKLLLRLLSLFLLAALAGRLIVTLLPDWGLLSAAFVLIALSHADFLS